MDIKKEKCSKTQKGRIVIHKGDEEKRIYVAELKHYLDQGWETGTSAKHKASISKKHVGKEPWNKGKKGVMKKNITTWRAGHEPWNKGKKGLQQSWNKNKTHENDARIATGPKHTKEFKENASCRMKAHNPMWNLSKEKMLIKVSKTFLTKKLNNSFNTSKPEEDLYKYLLTENKTKTIFRQYKDERYPFYCDFYIQEDDLFIELNAHWTHGGHPFDPNSVQDQEQLAKWREKAKQSKFYRLAIYVWTQLDVKKQKIAKQNNLNYRVIY